MMKTLFILCMLLAAGGTRAQGKQHENLIRAYYQGWEDKDWNEVAATLGSRFTFTSPAPDDHISQVQFKSKCWVQAEHIKKFEFVKIVDSGDQSFVLFNMTTMEGKVVRNTELFTFKDGKIASIEVFFGGTGQGYPTNQVR